MLNIFEGANEVIEENEDEKRLLEMVARLEQDAIRTPVFNEDGEESILVLKEAFFTLCSAAAMAYESKSWYDRENQLLEQIYQCGQVKSLPSELQEELNNWWADRQKDICLSKELKRKVERWEQRRQ